MTNRKPKTPTHIKELVADPENRRKHTPRNVGLIVDGLQKVGAARSIVIDEDGVILAGNATVEAAAEAGITNLKVVEATGNEVVAVRRTGLTDDQKRDLAIYDNRTSELAEWDVDQLMKDVDAGIDLSSFFNDKELSEILADAPILEGQTDPDEVPDERDTTIQRGDLFALGDHRLLCGDSTKAEDVARLMDGKKAEMMFTDPPYGVNYKGGHGISGGHVTNRKTKKMENDQSVDVYAVFLPVALSVVDGPCYMWFAEGVSGTREVYNAVHDNECVLHSCIVWHKTNAGYAAMNAHYKLRFEPCLYFKPKGSPLRWCGSTTESTVWSQDRDGINEYHTTQKPVALAAKAIRNHESKTVLDLFLGSGSTLIAAEQLDRKCYGMEIDPSYCQVIIDRWEAFTGKKAEKCEHLNISRI